MGIGLPSAKGVKQGAMERWAINTLAKHSLICKSVAR
jgi:hypothetical protein